MFLRYLFLMLLIYFGEKNVYGVCKYFYELSDLINIENFKGMGLEVLVINDIDFKVN